MIDGCGITHFHHWHIWIASRPCAAILFLSDGAPNEWTNANYDSVRQQASDLGGVQIFTYALGSGAQTDVLKGISCRNEGALWTISDGGNLADAMADYYTFLAPLQQACQVRRLARWSDGKARWQDGKVVRC